MKDFKYYLIIIKYTLSGLLLGAMLVLNAVLLNYKKGFSGPWFHIFDFSPDFSVIVLTPFLLALLFCFIGTKRAQLVLFNQQIKDNLSREQMLSSVTDKQVKLLGKVVSQINEAVIISDEQGFILWVNEGFTEITGYSMEEVLGKKPGSFLQGPETNMDTIKRIRENIRQQKAVVEEVLNYRRDGSTYWVRISIKPIYNDKGELSNYIAIENDITNRKEKELAIENLYKEVADYKFALDEAAIVSIFNTQGKIVHVNKKFCELNGLSERYLIGKDYRFISISMRDKGTLKPIWEKLNKGKIWKGELINRNPIGKTYWADTTIVPLLDVGGRPHHFLAIQNDITERKELENELLESKNKLEQAMQIAKFGTWELDVVNKCITLSKEVRTILNLGETTTISIDQFFSYVHPDDAGHIRNAMHFAGVAPQKIKTEYRCISDGVVKYITTNIAPRTYEDGSITGSFGTMEDITQRKLVELALKKSEEEKAVVLNNTQTIICLHDLNGVVIDVNAAAEKMSGYKKDEIVGLNLKLLLAPEHRDKFADYLSELATQKTAVGSFQIITKSGKKRAWLYQNTVYHNNDTAPYVIASAIDISESVKAQNEIERQQQLIRQIIDNSPNVIFVLNEQGQIVLANKTFVQYYPCDEKEMPFADKLSRGPEDIFLGDVESLMDLEEGDKMRLEGSVEHPADNTTGWFNIIKTCFKDKAGRKFVLCFGMDITGRHQVESDLLAANEMVERSLKIKDQFISNMSHEIRTPLNAVIGFTDLLADTSLNKEQAEYVQIVKTASQNLLALINNILDLSKIESGNLSLESQPINVAQVVSDAVKILEPKARRKGIEMRLELSEDIPQLVMGDQLRLSQILFNLLGNAVKFTDEGYVEISCRKVKGSDENKHYIAFTVKDTGIGVPKEKQKDIFERFTQANVDTQRLYGGTGLGLNIAKSIVDMHGGTLSMESTQGVGTTFHFILTYQPCEDSLDLVEVKSESGATILSVNSKKAVHILLAEDNMINAMLAMQVLANGGFTVEHVVNGALAVEAVQQKTYDVVLMDIQMPVMNGIEATKTIRQLSSPVSTIPIVAMTAHSMYGEMQNCYSAGMSGYISKPFKPENLYKVIVDSMRSENERRMFNSEYGEAIANV
ncbi:MAG TPA: PAS domain S-box protein [Ferruginibacter sp.]|nr:PAS domain S-box protein [Ferruginibacter sp.]HMP22205.1 PAS domain S-box protein [Ferruginibacter sp.]